MISKNIKNILVVAESIDVEDSSGTKGRVALIKNLGKSGYDVLVYHYTRKEIELKGIPCVAIKEKRSTGLFFLSRLERYIRIYCKISLNKYFENLIGFSFTLFNDRNSIVAALKKINDFNPDLVLTLSQGGSFRPHHALMKIPEWHYKWMAYIHDPYPFSCYPRPYDWVEPGNGKKRNFFIEISKKANFLAYPSMLLAEWMESYYPNSKNKRVIIPHQMDKKSLMKGEKFPVYFKKDVFSIVHAGNLLSARNPIGLISAFRLFLERNPQAQPDCQLLFLGDKSIFSKKFVELQKEIPQFFATLEYVPFCYSSGNSKKCFCKCNFRIQRPYKPFSAG